MIWTRVGLFFFFFPEDNGEKKMKGRGAGGGEVRSIYEPKHLWGECLLSGRTKGLLYLAPSLLHLLSPTTSGHKKGGTRAAGTL